MDQWDGNACTVLYKQKIKPIMVIGGLLLSNLQQDSFSKRTVKMLKVVSQVQAQWLKVSK